MNSSARATAALQSYLEDLRQDSPWTEQRVQDHRKVVRLCLDTLEATRYSPLEHDLEQWAAGLLTKEVQPIATLLRCSECRAHQVNRTEVGVYHVYCDACQKGGGADGSSALMDELLRHISDDLRDEVVAPTPAGPVEKPVVPRPRSWRAAVMAAVAVVSLVVIGVLAPRFWWGADRPAVAEADEVAKDGAGKGPRIHPQIPGPVRPTNWTLAAHVLNAFAVSRAPFDPEAAARFVKKDDTNAASEYLDFLAAVISNPLVEEARKPAYRDALFDSLWAKDEKLLRDACRAARFCPSDRVKERLLHLLRWEEHLVAVEAARSLVVMGVPEGRDALVSLADSYNWSAAHGAVHALDMLDDPSVLEIARRLIGHENANLVSIACDILGDHRYALSDEEVALVTSPDNRRRDGMSVSVAYAIAASGRELGVELLLTNLHHRQLSRKASAIRKLMRLDPYRYTEEIYNSVLQVTDQEKQYLLQAIEGETK